MSYAQHAEALIDASEPAEALRLAEASLASAPQDWRGHAVRARALRTLGRAEGALAALDHVLRLNPGAALAQDARAVLLAEAGRMAEARAGFEAALALDPRLARAHFGLASLGRVSAAQRAALEALAAEAASFDETARLFLLYALVIAYDEAGEAARAFAAAEAGAALRRARWSGDAAHELERLSRARPSGAPPAAGAATEAPLFVIGMPRSGTTLVEHILARHPQVVALGEIEAFASTRTREGYLAQWPAAARAACVVDKSLGNALHVEEILAAFPRARFLAVRRDLADACLSCHFTFFAQEMPFPPDIAAIGRYARAHGELLDAWGAALPASTWRAVRYERLVAAPEAQARALVEFAGLDWDPRCLDAARGPAVRTASLAQVRAPIHAGSVGRAQRYAAFLGALEAPP